MPSTSAPVASKALSKGRFELPVLATLPSLTAGTDIPPPPDSPIEEEPPALLPKPQAENGSAAAEGAVNGNGAAKATTNGNGTSVSISTGAYTGRGRTSSNNAPGSPISLTRPSSIRRFLSRKSMYNSYANGSNGNTSSENVSTPGEVGFRPDSPSAFSTVTAKKRSSSWFRRTIMGDRGDEPLNKRASIVYEEKPKGPPPPMLPELDQFKSKVLDDEGSLGADDMFKNVK